MVKFKTVNMCEEKVVTVGSRYDKDSGLFTYSFSNTPFGLVRIFSANDYTRHQHALMVLLEMSYDKNDIWWNNVSNVNNVFKDMCVKMLDDQEYFKPMFKLCTEYLISETLKELNSLIDYTEYWTGEI